MALRNSVQAAACLLLCGAALACAQTPNRPAPIASATETTVADGGLGTAPPIDLPKVETASETNAAGELAHGSAPTATVKQPYHLASKLWKMSVGATIGANAAASASGWGKPQSNPLLGSNGTFGLKGLLIRSSSTGSAVASQYTMRDHQELHKSFAIVNFLSAGMFSRVAVHNLSAPPVAGH